MVQPPPAGWPPGPYGQPPPYSQQPQYGQPPEYGPQPPYGQQPQYGPPPPWLANPYFPPPAAPKPGCVPLRPLGVGEILDGSFQVIRRNPRATLGLSVIIAVIQASITGVFQYVLYREVGQARLASSSDSTDPSATVGPLLGELTTAFTILVIGALLGAILTGMLTAVITQDVLGVKLSMGQAWARARSRIWALFGLALVTTVLPVLGLIPCLVIGVWLWGIWAVAVPAMMVEGATIRGSLRRSKQLVDGSFWRVWGIRALGTLMVSVVSSIIVLPFEAIGLIVSGGGVDSLFGQTGGLPVVFVVFMSLGSVLSLTITAPVTAAISALLYVDLRMRREGLDLVLQQQAAQHAVGTR
jgi:hypothetical protein